MKNLLFLTLILFGTTFVSSAQKYAYIDSEYILGKMPEYQNAKDELDKYATRWQKEIQQRYTDIDKKEKEFLRVEPVLPKEERARRQADIDKMKKQALEMQKQRFGVNGDLFAKRKELIEPIQDKVFSALQKVASRRNFAFVFDKANQSNLIFADPKYDISKMVLRELGINDRSK